MSYSGYRNLLPTHFHKDATAATDEPAETIGEAKDDDSSQSQSSTSRGEDSQNASDVGSKQQREGFIDIVEYHLHYPDKKPLYFLTKNFVRTAALLSERLSPRKFQDCAIILRRVWSMSYFAGDFPMLVGIWLEIHSEPLCEWLRENATKTYQTTDFETVPIRLPSPFRELFFYRAEIQALAEDAGDDKDLQRDAKALNTFVQQPDGLMASIIEDHARFLKEGKVLNDILWTIFPPKSLLVLDTGPIRECWICWDVIQKKGTHGGKLWVIQGLRISFDGWSPSLAQQEFVHNNPATGLKLITISDLPLTPIGHYKGREELEEDLQQRYRRLSFALGPGLSSFACKSYRGAAWDNRTSRFKQGESPSLTAKQVDERVIVDFKSSSDLFTEKSVYIPDNRGIFTARGVIPSRDRCFRRWRLASPSRLNSSSLNDSDLVSPPRLNSSSSNDSDSENEDLCPISEDFETAMTYSPIGETAPLTDSSGMLNLGTLDQLAESALAEFRISKGEFAMLFPALVPVFGLKSNKWRLVLSDRLQDSDWSTARFESLQHNQSTKRLLEALVEGYKAKDTASDGVLDVGRKRLVLHLHGGHGSGKTFTAECIAGHLERPLYCISGRALSHESDDAEEKVHEIFEQAKRWSAVLLLKEAEALFGIGTSDDLATNNMAITRAFFRAIEDFQGVVILTTTERKVLNKDIKSLIDLTIRYPELSSEAQARIWENLIQGTRDIETDQSWNDTVYEELGKLNMNGRGIKNTLRTAVAFANAEKKPLGAHHVLAILQAELSAEDFDDGKEKWEKQMQPALHKLHEMLDVPF